MKLIGAANAGEIADQALLDLRRLEAVLEIDMMRIVTKLDTTSGEDSLKRNQARIAAAVLKQVHERLVAEGQQIRSIAASRAVQAVEVVLGKSPTDLNSSIKSELDMIMNQSLSEISEQFKQIEDEIRQAILIGVTSTVSLADLIVEIQSKLKTNAFRAQSSVDTAIMAVGRLAVMSAAYEVEDALDLVYVYVGPKDEKNRDYCRQWVGKACTNPAATDNGQKLKADIFCGGYNCRHTWAPTPIDEAIAEGYDIYDENFQPFVVNQ
jgi:hypothetical protein